jgi:hypothetical protein
VLGDEGGRRAERDDPPGAHHRDVVGEALGLLDVVGRHQHGHALGAQRGDERPQLLPHLRVEPDGRLVEQHERGRCTSARAMSSRAACRRTGRRRGAGAAVSCATRARGRRRRRGRARDAVEPGEDLQVLPDGELDVEVVLLRHDAHLRPRLLGLPRHLEAEHLDRPLVGDGLRGEQPHGVDLPAPFGPSSPRQVPARTSRSRPSTARRRRRP